MIKLVASVKWNSDLFHVFKGGVGVLSGNACVSPWLSNQDLIDTALT